jgi:hypothetical protein
MEYVANLEKELREIRQQAESSDRQLKQSSGILNRLKNVFTGEKEPVKDKYQEANEKDEKFLDSVITTALESEKKGMGSMPITTQLSAMLIESNKQIRELEKELKEVKSSQERLKDPSVAYDNQAYAKIDMEIEKAAETLYGKADGHFTKMVTEQIVEEINRLKTESPEIWDKIRRNGDAQVRMARHFVSKAVPPKAAEILYQQKMQNEEMSKGQLLDAFRQTYDTYKDSPKEGEKVRRQIREELLATQFKSAWKSH